jgi:ADP-heptose:LPS heptosyltransferase
MNPSSKPNAATEVRQALILEYRLPLGCLVHMTPVFEAIKRSRPEIEITVATRGPGLQVLRHSPYVDHLIETPDPTTHLVAAVGTLRSELRRRRICPDCVLTGASDRRTKIALLALLGSSGWRGGFTLKPALYRQPLQYDQGRSLIANNLKLATLVGGNDEPIEPRIFFSPGDAKIAANLLQTANPKGQPVVAVVTQNSGGQSTGWHTDRFVRVVRNAAERGFAVVYVGVAQESAAIDAIREAAGGIGVSVAGKTTINQLAALLAQTDFAVTLDTGTMHVARSVRLPMVILGPSWQKPIEWLPLNLENVRILRGEDRVGVPEGYRLDEISAENVIAALGELVELYPPTPEARESRLQSGLSEIDRLGN